MSYTDDMIDNLITRMELVRDLLKAHQTEFIQAHAQNHKLKLALREALDVIGETPELSPTHSRLRKVLEDKG